MKKIYLILLAFALTMNYSCSNILDTYPKDKVSSSIFWKSKNDVKLALAGCYTHLKSSPYLSHLKPYLDCITDNGYCWQSEHASIAQMQTGILTPTTEGVVSSIYNAMYKGITACYIFIDNFERIKDDLGYTENEQNQILAEARLLKGYYLFELIQRFGGVVIYDKVPTIEDSKIAKRGFEESVEYVLNDVDFAIENLPDKVYKGHVVKNTALGLKARIALFMKDWATVKNVTAQIIDSANKGITSFSSDYDPIFIKRLGQNDCSEILFSVDYMAPDSKQWFGIEIEGFYWSGISPLKSFIKTYAPTDRRLKEWYYESSDGSYLRPTDNTSFMPVNTTKTGYGCVKFFDKNNPEKYLVNPYDIVTDDNAVLMRYTEILLMYAEAMVEIGNGSTNDNLAINSINMIRERACLEPISGSLDRETLRNERRLELAFEGFRLFDLHRWRIAENIMNGLESIAGICKFESNQYLWPFPQSEIDVNPQLEQNPGY